MPFFFRRHRHRDRHRRGDVNATATVGIRPGGGGVVPAVDAPVSAVNAGERVSISCGRAVVAARLVQEVE